MPAHSQRKGQRWETAVAAYLRDSGVSVWNRQHHYQPGADMAATVGGRTLAVECKNHARLDLAGWLAQAVAQARPGATPLLVVKRRGRSDPGDAYAVVRLGDLIGLLSPEPGGESPEPF